MSDDKKIEKLETPSESTTSSAKSTGKKKVKGSNRIARWFREMRSELKKVVWPTPKQIVNNTFVSLTVMAVSAVAIWALDLAATQIFEAIRTFVPRLFAG
ncbi:MAG: preprotein translocase subunit SecE [Oscillospiraceae bacterium]|nr:preprotein translocase subunit SecE [Oscillospiraceae bacterium]